jgi:hypothetical protein
MASAASIIGSFFMVVFSFGYDFLGVNELTPLRRRHLKWFPHPCIDCHASDWRSRSISFPSISGIETMRRAKDRIRYRSGFSECRATKSGGAMDKSRNGRRFDRFALH